MDEKLIAPCGMNCGICVSYLAMQNNLKKKGFSKKYCEGCLPRGKNCAFMKGNCELLGKGLVRFCYECKEFPCRRLKSLDKRYRDKYHMSMIENQEFIQEHGIEKFLEKEEKKWKCPKCGDAVCCHNGLCMNCQLDILLQNKKYCWDDEKAGMSVNLITEENLISLEKDQISQLAQTLEQGEIEKLVDWLSLKDDKVRYNAFLLLQERSKQNADVYPYWNVFQSKLKNENSYQRSIGIMLIAENVKWDLEDKMNDIIQEYLNCLYDEKMITVRQCIQSLKIIARETTAFHEKITNDLLKYDVMAVRESMRKLVLLDIIDTLVEIRKAQDKKEINEFILQALTGEILDKKSKKRIEGLLL